MARTRGLAIGLRIGAMEPGPLDAITDVPGVRVGHTTIIEGDGPLRVGEGPVRTGVTVIVPHDDAGGALYAGCHRLNGNGELTGLEWVRESGMLTSPVAITNTHSLGVVRDAIVAADAARHSAEDVHWALPVVGETYDGRLNDINGQHVRPEHVFAALDSARDGPVEEGNVGGGTGMICHEFKGGIGTASRRVPAESGGFTVGVLVQANHGWRERLVIDGVPVGRAIRTDEVPSPWEDVKVQPGGSVIVVVATDAPLLPHQCDRVAQRAALGIARTGGAGEHSSGDLILSFATGNRGLSAADTGEADEPVARSVQTLSDARITSLFWATIEATEAAIVNALLAAETMTGRDGITAHALPLDRLNEIMERHHDGRSSTETHGRRDSA